MFSLALTRTTPDNPTSGGLPALGGIPPITHSPTFATVPIKALSMASAAPTPPPYRFYIITVDWFSIATVDPMESQGGARKLPFAAAPSSLAQTATVTGDEDIDGTSR
jgi:hypothetical protein